MSTRCRADGSHPHARRTGQSTGQRLLNNAGDGTVEVSVLSLWESLAHIVAFAGPNYLQPTIPPSHLGKVFDKEPAVHHYKMNEIPLSLRDWTSSGPDQAR